MVGLPRIKLSEAQAPQTEIAGVKANQNNQNTGEKGADSQPPHTRINASTRAGR